MFFSSSKFGRLAALGFFLAASLPAGATTLRPVSGDDQIRGAEMIFRGRVDRVEVAREQTPQGAVLVSRVTFQPLAIYKGQPGASVTLRFLGGVLGDEELKVDGMPRFETGGEYVLFVSGGKNRACPVIGWTAGSLEVNRRSRPGGEIMLSTAAPGLVRQPAAKSRTGRSDDCVDLPAFEATLRARVAEIQSGR